MSFNRFWETFIWGNLEQTRNAWQARSMKSTINDFMHFRYPLHVNLRMHGNGFHFSEVKPDQFLKCTYNMAVFSPEKSFWFQSSGVSWKVLGPTLIIFHGLLIGYFNQETSQIFKNRHSEGFVATKLFSWCIWRPKRIGKNILKWKTRRNIGRKTLWV